MKTIKRFVLFLIIGVFWVAMIRAQNTNPKSGKCGSDIEWSFDGRTLTLTNADPRKGVASIPDYDLSKDLAPWVKQKLAMRAGETDKAITVDLPEVREIGAAIGRNLKHIGNLDVDIMQRANGDYCVLELNPRFGGGYPFSYEAGVNMPLAIVKWLKGESVDSAILEPKYGKTFAKNDYLVEVE